MNEHVYKCGSFNYSAQASRTCHCREREAHNQTKAERDEAREQNAKLRDIAERAIDECWFWSDKSKAIQADWDKLNEEGAK